MSPHPARPVAPLLPSVRLVLIGMMGSGKSTVGRELASRTGWPMLDNDTLLAEQTGQDAKALAQRGSDVLHDAEADVARRLLDRAPPYVAGVAAAVVGYPDVVDQLRARACAVYLRAAVSTLAERVRHTHRPWLGADPVAVLTKLYEGREALYHQAASAVIDVDHLTPHEVADAAIDLIVRRPSASASP